MHRRLRNCTLFAATVVALAAPAAAQATTVTIEGDKVAIRGDGTESNYILLSVAEFYGETGKWLQISDQVAINYPSGPCKLGGEYDDRVYCAIPSGGVVVDGGEGNDHLSLFSDFDPNLPVQMYGGGGKDKLEDQYNLAGPTRTLDGGAGDDTLASYVGNDVLIGGDGNDELDGGVGSDELRGGPGNDLMYGDLYKDDWGADILDGGPGFDTGDAWYIPSSTANNSPVHITQDGKADDGRAGENDNVTSIEKLETNAPSGTFTGTDGDDEIITRSQDDTRVLTGLGGNDKLEGGYGIEQIDGGAGNDAINGGYGHDTIVGGPGQDVINGDGGSYCGWYTCSVPFGNDTIKARDGEVDQIECGVGEDNVEADATDVVAASCEKVDKSGPVLVDDGDNKPKPGDAVAQALGFKLAGKASLRSGMAFSVACGSACTVTSQLLYKGKAVGKGAKTALAAGSVKVAVKLSKAGKRKLKRLKKAKLTLKVSIKDAAGKTTAFSRAVAFKK